MGSHSLPTGVLFIEFIEQPEWVPTQIAQATIRTQANGLIAGHTNHSIMEGVGKFNKTVIIDKGDS